MKSARITTTFLFVFLCFCVNQGFSQLNLPNGSQKASVSQRIGISDITIKYSRPSVRGREVWGKLVPYGLNNLGFGTSKQAPWRAGADENTTITLTHNATIEGQPVNAGTYGFHVNVKDETNATIILSSDTESWGSYFYNPEHDVLRVDVKTKTVPHRELLTYEFNEVKPNETVVSLLWEQKEIPFKVAFDVTQLVLGDFKEKSKGSLGFNRQNWEQAATYALNNGGDLNEALNWINGAIAGNFYSKKTFNNLQTKALILNKLGEKEEADAVMKEALPLGTVFEVHQLGRGLIANGENDKAMEVFKMNAKKYKGQWPVHYGLARAFSAKGDYKTALKHLKLALNNAPNDASKGRVQANIDKLKKGEDIN